MNRTVIFALVRLRLLRVARDRSGLVWLLVMPMVFSFLMGQLLGGMGGGSADRPVFMVYDGDGGALADSLLAPLADHERFRLVRVDTLVDPEAARLPVEEGGYTAALIVPPGYSAGGAAGDSVGLTLFVDSDRLSSQTVRTLLDEGVLAFNTRAAAAALALPDTGVAAEVPFDRAAGFDDATFDRLWSKPRLTLRTGVLGRLAEKRDWALTDISQHVGPAYILFFMLMFMLVTAKDLVKERRERTLARLITSRAGNADLVLGFFLGGMAIGLIQAAVLLLLNRLAFGLDYGDSPAGLILMLLLFAGFAAAASVLLGSLARSEAQADGLGTALTMSMAALGGLWWPLEAVPEFMQKLGGLLPTGQAITVFHDLIGRGYGVAELTGPLTGLTVWFVVVLGLAAWRLRRLVQI